MHFNFYGAEDERLTFEHTPSSRTTRGRTDAFPSQRFRFRSGGEVSMFWQPLESLVNWRFDGERLLPYPSACIAIIGD